MKGLLLFLAGLLVGANLVYFLVSRDCRSPASSLPTTTTAEAPTQQTATRTETPPAVAPPVGAPPPASTSMPAPPSTAAPAPATPATALLLPVADIKFERLTDTFNQSRGTQRRHEALDIMAARGTPVLAAVDGKVEKLFNSKQGGLTIYEFDPAATYAYYYAHLDRYAPGLVEGMQLKRGDLIGYVGSSGNANPDAPHLHFAIFELGPEKQWWQGTAINPYPLLTTPR